MKRIFIFFAILITCFSSFAQEDTLNVGEIIIDSAIVINVAEEVTPEIFTDTVLYTNFNSNLDKMVNLWYVQQSEYNKYQDRPLFGHDSSFIPQCTPEEYKKRIAKMNSVIPLTYNDQVQAFINLYAFRKRDKVEIMLGLSEYYFPIFEEILITNNVPAELKYLSIIESALNPRATSPVGAAGLWQFMPGTGKMYKLDISSYLDERRDPIQATEAAAKYLGLLHGMFGDWLLAIAAYNCGPGNVRKAITRSGGKTNFWEIFPYLPRETRGYVPAFIAAYYVFEYHAEHNLYARDINFPPVVDTVMITQTIHLQQVSEVLNVSLQMLQDINPQYKIGIIPANDKGNALYLPIDYVTPFLLFQDSIIKYKDSVYLQNAVVSKDDSLDKSSATPTVLSGTKSTVYYYVKKGDNLSLIANWYDVSVSDIRSWNKVSSSSLHVGRKLAIKVPSEKKDYYTGITRMSFSQKQRLSNNSNASTVATTSSTKSSSTSKSSSSKKTKYVYHTVHKGDTLWAISQKYDNVTPQDIMQLNGLSRKSKITPGMKLKIRTM